MNKDKYTKTIIQRDWKKVTKVVNKRRGTDHSINYIQSVWYGRLKSQPIMDILIELLGEPDAE